MTIWIIASQIAGNWTLVQQLDRLNHAEYIKILQYQPFVLENHRLQEDSSYKDQGPSQYPKRRLSVRSRQVSKPRDLYLELSDRSEIWQAVLPMWLSNFKAIRQFKVPISWLRDFTRSYEKTSFRILRRGPGTAESVSMYWRHHINPTHALDIPGVIYRWFLFSLLASDF